MPCNPLWLRRVERQPSFGRLVLNLTSDQTPAAARRHAALLGEGCMDAVAVPLTADVTGDTGTVTDCVRAEVGFCEDAMGRSGEETASVG
jgi:hypothetical protein